MSAETKPPFDPEAEARRFRDLGCPTAIPEHLGVYARAATCCFPCLVAALARAYEAGAADMRERAARALVDSAAGSGRLAELAALAGDREGERTHRNDVHALAGAIQDVRALPLSETR